MGRQEARLTMKKPKNQYEVRIVSQKTAVMWIEADSENEVQNQIDNMSSDDVNWDSEEWPEVDIELCRTGKWSLLLVVPAVLKYLKECSFNESKEVMTLHSGLSEAWSEWRNNYKATDILRSQEDQYGIFEPKDD